MINTIIKVLTLGCNVNEDNAIIQMYKKKFEHEVLEHNKAYLYSDLSKDKQRDLLHMKDIKVMFREKQKEIKEIGIKDISRNEYLEYLLLALYTIVPPLRGEEYYATRVKRCKKKEFEKCVESDDYNFYDMTNGNLVIKNYKTQRAYGTRIIKFPPRLKKIIKDWIENFGDGSEWLIPAYNDKGKHITQQAFTETLFRVFSPYKISSSMLRKIYISDCVKRMNGVKRQEIARIMGHSLQMQEFVYKKKHKKNKENI